MSKEQVETKVVKNYNEIKFEGMEKDDIIAMNEIIFKLDELRKTYHNSVEQFKNMIIEFHAQLWFLEVSTKDTPKDEEKYNEIRSLKIKQTKEAIESYERAQEEQEQLLNNVQSYLDILNTHIEFDIRIDEYDKKEHFAIYDKNFFKPIIDLAKNIGWVDLDDLGKKNKKKA